MEVFTREQELLADYLISLGMPMSRGLYIIGILWNEDATLEMLKYIAETEETDQKTLVEIACQISKKYEAKTDSFD